MAQKITKEEQAAVDALRKLAKTWPKSLGLFSWSGTLCVVHVRADGCMPLASKEEADAAIIACIYGIKNDGGCP